MLVISENLRRADLTKLERDEQIAEWIRLAEKKGAGEKPSQLATVSKGGRGNEGGVRAAARELHIDKDDAHRATKVASLSDEAKRAAREVGLDNKRSVLLKASREEDSDKQAEAIRKAAAQKAARKEPKVAADPLTDELAAECQVARLMDAWNAAGPDTRSEFSFLGLGLGNDHRSRLPH
ncbi:hypothetical protein [Methylocystis sp. B8]|uniref:hypothetical protein n=1 Tax=Methylocystis sp. B8 TaxID=544938 RepID=UPI0010FDDB0B|nr:hypothetical protein [Methylocystis sp. B8]TLG71836.1 hypothetical protein FEV16_15180 [Methylocystis sp. B8]